MPTLYFILIHKPSKQHFIVEARDYVHAAGSLLPELVAKLGKTYNSIHDWECVEAHRLGLP